MGMMRQLYDGLQNVVTGLGTRHDARMGRSYFAQHMTPQQIEDAYDGSAMLRKAISIPATDRVRAWRDWQAEADQIEALEAEEGRHELQAKVKLCEVLRGLGGGAMVLVAAGDPAMPINVTGKGGLVAVNVVTRWHLSGQNWNEDLASADYGKPEYWEITGSKTRTRIHPSRVVCFRGEPMPSIWSGTWEDRFWGKGKVPTLLEPAQNLDEALSTFAAMIKDALNIDIGIPGLLDLVATDAGENKIMRRLSLMQEGSSVIRAKVYDKGDPDGKGGESIDRHQVTWTGIPEVIRVYAEALSAASDIPVTRLWGTSAKGLNATGEGDEKNWRETVETGQKLETKPCLEQIDVALIPSALGSRPPEVWWQFAPLSIPTEKEETDRFKMWTDAMEKVSLSGAIPEVAYNKAYQTGLVEGGWMPGLEGALAEIPEAERFGGAAEPDDTDPSAMQAGAEVYDPRLAANDAKPMPLYVRRDLLNGADLITWAKENGFTSTLPAEDMHVTVLYSKVPVDPMKMGETWGNQDDGGLTIKAGGPRALEKFGEGAIVLQFASWNLVHRHDEMVRNGASHDFEEYLPHVTISYDPPEGFDIEAVKPFNGELRFGPEIFERIDPEWKSKIGQP